MQDLSIVGMFAGPNSRLMPGRRESPWRRWPTGTGHRVVVREVQPVRRRCEIQNAYSRDIDYARVRRSRWSRSFAEF